MNILRPALFLILAVAVAGCGHRDRRPTSLTPKGGYKQASQDWRIPVQQVTELEVAPTTTGAIVNATGLASTQGWWGASLVAENDGEPVDGVMTYRFVVARPLPGSSAAQTVSTPQSREVTAAAFINANRFENTRKVVVLGAEGSRAASAPRR